MRTFEIGEPETGVTAEEVGGKGKNLINAAKLLDGRVLNPGNGDAWRIEVPSGFVVTGEIHEEFVEEQKWKYGFLHVNGWESVGEQSESDNQEWKDVLQPEDVSEWRMPSTYRETLHELFESLDAPVAVRSSGAQEDSDGNNYAGRFESILGLNNFEDFVSGFNEVMASYYDAKVLEYEEEIGAEAGSQLRFVVQESKNPDVSGVMYTRGEGGERTLIELNEGLPTTIVDQEAVDQAVVSVEDNNFVFNAEEDYHENPNRDVKEVLEDGEIKRRETEEDGMILNPRALAVAYVAGRELEIVSGEEGDRSPRDMEVGFDRENNTMYLFQDRPDPGQDFDEVEPLPDIPEDRLLETSRQVSGNTNYEDITTVVLDNSNANPDPENDIPAYELEDYDLEELDEELERYALVTQEYNEDLNRDVDPDIVIATESGFGGHLVNILSNEDVDTDYISILGGDLDEEIGTYDEINIYMNGAEAAIEEVR